VAEGEKEMIKDVGKGYFIKGNFIKGINNERGKMNHKNVELYNVQEIIESKKGNGKLLTRIPDELRVTLNESAKNNAIRTAGCEIRFNLKSETAKIVLETAEEAIPLSIAEVYQGVFKISSHIIKEGPTEISISLPANIELLDKITKEKNLPFDAHLIRVILPHLASTKIINIERDFSLPDKEQTPRTKYLAYGSSITHGFRAIRPTGSYAMRTAQLLGVDLINLGFGGGAHCENQLADYIAERNDWDFATLELGINMIAGFKIDEFKKRVEYFIPRIAQAHPDKWIFCIDLFTFYSIPRAEKQDEFRTAVRDTVTKLNMPKLVHIDGREILKNPSGLITDLVHPSPEGMEEMALNLSGVIKEHI